LADVDRIGYFMIGWDQISIWELPGYGQAQVFLPNENDVKILLEDAINQILTPAPLTDQVQTLEAQLTAAYQATASPEIINTSTPTLTLTSISDLAPSPSPTPSPTGGNVNASSTPTLTPQGYP
jgi:hypothetical protein